MALAVPNELGHPRLGLVVSKKNLRRAVDRNRLKRLARESIRLQQHQLPALDIVLLARRGVGELDNATLHRQLHGMWRRLARDAAKRGQADQPRSEEHTSELQSRPHLVCRLLLEKKKQRTTTPRASVPRR